MDDRLKALLGLFFFFFVLVFGQTNEINLNLRIRTIMAKRFYNLFGNYVLVA